jgi:hypothetical protein
MADVSKVKFKHQGQRDSTRLVHGGQPACLPCNLRKLGTLQPAPIYFGPDFPYHVRCQQTRAWTEFAL